MVDSRASEDGDAIRRRRSCPACEHRFTTYERIERAPLVVQKRSGDRVEFDGTKIISGLRSAAKGRPIADGEMVSMVADLEDTLRVAGGVVSSETVGRAVLDWLRNADHIAYLRFASVYKGFDDPSDFQRELAALSAEE